MKNKLALIFGIVVWLAVILQYYLMMGNRVVGIFETTIRFFSFFTILTNTLVAVYFTIQASKKEHQRDGFWDNPGTLTAIAAYILVVGLVYQFILRPIWDPQGLAMVTDELLHSVNPLLVLYFWFRYEKKELVKWNQVSYWLIYPLLYFIWAMSHGLVSGFYPYPFVNLPEIGLTQLMINFVMLFGVFSGLSLLLVWIGKKTQVNS
ncbi:MAG: hypothetical protein EA341_13240 [Mongoliibacter sp.]|uniref:Pr6Pr family membrane protein n=1 Tax=Mongoliibacter sp. TaxID=2022438 RepID=UPI0012F0AA32|nr:Pr6Pr family membrane protein [Mongoliibacter sp.]TVP46927.1 MAG: hypothetical protein EA341_13240 [Mongoliibacter sp.]